MGLFVGVFGYRCHMSATGLLVNANAEVSELTLTKTAGSYLGGLNEALGASYVERIQLPGGIDLWVDEEGLTTQKENPLLTFVVESLAGAGAEYEVRGAGLFLTSKNSEVASLTEAQKSTLSALLTAGKQ